MADKMQTNQAFVATTHPIIGGNAHQMLYEYRGGLPSLGYKQNRIRERKNANRPAL
jgi:hypothetical protein